MEELDGDGVVAAFREVRQADEVPTTQVDADVHVLRPRTETVVVKFYVGVQKSGCIFIIFFEVFEYFLSAEVRQIKVVYLDVGEASVVEDLEPRSVCFCDVGEVFRIIGVDFFWIGSAGLVSKKIPIWCG